MRILSALAGMIFFSGVLLGASAETSTAKADLTDAKGEKVGSVQLTEAADGVKIALDVWGLSPGPHGFHIHTAGKCEPPDFKTAGGHFNPQGKKHGLNNPDGAHAGDMLNIEVGADGKGKTQVVNKQVTLGAGTNSLFHEGGTAIVIHGQADDGMTDPAGNAGPRVACGVVTK